MWESLQYLVLNKSKLVYGGFINITESDLDMSLFEQLEMNITVTDKFNIDLTIKELTEQYNKCMLTPNVKLPILLTFSIEEIDTIEEYIKLIVLCNPLSDVHYMDFIFGDNNISYGDKVNTYIEKIINNGDSSIKSIECYEEEDEFPKIPIILKIKICH